MKEHKLFFNKMVYILDKNDIKKTDKELSVLISKKNSNAAYAALLLSKVKLNSPDFNVLCKILPKSRG